MATVDGSNAHMRWFVKPQPNHKEEGEEDPGNNKQKDENKAGREKTIYTKN